MQLIKTLLAPLTLLLAIACSPKAAPTANGGGTRESKARVEFIGGYETDPRDGGRPVTLIAVALQVPIQVFRDAFSKVTPSRNGPPSQEHAQANKKILMDALGKHGVSNKRLDEVSNFYRYRPQDGELWSHRPAEATAIIENGKVMKFEITDPGYGYSSMPTISVPGFPGLKTEVTLKFTADLKENGSVTAIKVLPTQ